MGRRLTIQMIAAVAIGALLGVGLHLAGIGEVAPSGAATGGGPEVAGASLERDPSVGAGPIAALEGGVLWVEAGGCGDLRQASATVVRRGDDIVVLTNAHVVKGSGTVTLRDPEGRTVIAQVLGSVAGRDAAVLEVSDEDAASLVAIPVAGTPSLGDPLVVAGHPDGTARADRGRLASVERRAAFGGSSDVLVVEAPVQGGSSGGAVLDEAGHLVGLVAAKDPVSGWAVAYPIAEVLGRALGPIPSC